MPRLSTAQFNARQRLIELGTLGLDVETLGLRTLETISSVVPNNGMRLWTVDSQTLLLNRLVASSQDPPVQRELWLRDVYLSEQANRIAYFSSHQVLSSGIGSVAILPEQDQSLGLSPTQLELTTDALHRSWFQETQSPVAGWSFVGLPVGRRWIGLLVTMHREPATRLNATRFAFLRATSPLIGRILDAAARREQAMHAAQPASHPEASGIVLVARDRSITFATPAGEHWLDLLADGEVPDGRRAHLPPAVYSVFRSLQQKSDSGATAPVASVIAPTRHGPIRLEASPASLDGSMAVVIGPANPAAAPVIPAHWPLTERERAIAVMIIGGAANRAIADSLYISEPTVESHVGHIFTKLGISSRTMLAGLLFRSRLDPDGVEASR